MRTTELSLSTLKAGLLLAMLSCVAWATPPGQYRLT